jgi:hypothetical protein
MTMEAAQNATDLTRGYPSGRTHRDLWLRGANLCQAGYGHVAKLGRREYGVHATDARRPLDQGRGNPR